MKKSEELASLLSTHTLRNSPLLFPCIFSCLPNMFFLLFVNLGKIFISKNAYSINLFNIAINPLPFVSTQSTHVTINSYDYSSLIHQYECKR